MYGARGPTTKSNASARVLLRFLLCYAASVALSLPCFRHYTDAPPLFDVGELEALFVLLAIVGAFLTIANTYLILLTVAKAVVDASALTALYRELSHGMSDFWAANALLFFFVFSLLLFCFAASNACLFSFESRERDLRLLLSRRCLVYCLHAVLLFSLSLLLYLLWPSLSALF